MSSRRSRTAVSRGSTPIRTIPTDASASRVPPLGNSLLRRPASPSSPKDAAQRRPQPRMGTNFLERCVGADRKTPAGYTGRVRSGERGIRLRNNGRQRNRRHTSLAGPAVRGIRHAELHRPGTCLHMESAIRLEAHLRRFDPEARYRERQLHSAVGYQPPGVGPGQRQTDRKGAAAGAKLIVIDPREHTLAKKADCWLRVRPGADGALALAMLHVLFDEDLIDTDFARNWTNAPFLVRTDTGDLLSGRDMSVDAGKKFLGCPRLKNEPRGNMGSRNRVRGERDRPIAVRLVRLPPCRTDRPCVAKLCWTCFARAPPNIPRKNQPISLG